MATQRVLQGETARQRQAEGSERHFASASTGHAVTEAAIVELLRARMLPAEALSKLGQAGVEHLATVLLNEHLQALEEGLEKLRSKEGALSAVLQRGLYSNRVVRQITASLFRGEIDPALARDVLSAEVMQVAEDAKNTIDSIEESGISDVLGRLRENIPRFGAAIPEEDVDLLGLLGIEHPEQTIALALARARNDLVAQEKRTTADLFGDLRDGAQAPIPSLEPFHAAPKYVLIEVEKMQHSVEPHAKWTPWKGIYKVIQGTVLGAGNIALALGATMSPALIMSAVGSVAGSIGSFGEGIDELSKRPAPERSVPVERRNREV